MSSACANPTSGSTADASISTSPPTLTLRGSLTELGREVSRRVYKPSLTDAAAGIRRSSTAWQATETPPRSIGCGRARAQGAFARGQRGWKAHPAGGAIGLGTPPLIGGGGGATSAAGVRARGRGGVGGHG